MKIGNCGRCDGWIAYTNKQPPPGFKRHHGHGLCDYCARVHGRGGHNRNHREPADEMAIARALNGDWVRTNPAERRVIIAELTSRGYSANQIAQRLGLAVRRVYYYRAQLRQEKAAA